MPNDRDAQDVFDVVQKLTCISKSLINVNYYLIFFYFRHLRFSLASPEQLYAYSYQPRPAFTANDGWKIYDPVAEFERMGVGKHDSWRFSSINRDYSVSGSSNIMLGIP